MRDKQNPIVEVFKIFGLHGYKDVTIDFPDPAKIIIAENGSGKTTILTALDAFLRSDYFRLYTIEFEKIVCKFSQSREEISLNKKDIASIAKPYFGEAMKQIEQFSNFSTNEIYEFITSQYRPEESNTWMQAGVASDIYVSSPFDWDEIKQHLDELKTEIKNVYNDELKYVNNQVAQSLTGIDILYLPTYRRVEKPIKIESQKARQRRIPSFGRVARRQRFSEPGIQYGLDDVQSKLIELSQEIHRRTNDGYRNISKEIIDDLLAGGITEYGGGSPSLPDLNVLKRFFSRVGDISDVQVASIERVYKKNPESTDSSEASQLLYFLSKLSTVVNKTYQLESTIEEFATISNAYLESTSDKKSLVYDPVNMAVSVVDSWTGANLTLNDLSSGEKQVVSLIAHLYLEPRDKIVLIDEPELSLSIEWQKKILPDIMRSPCCKQLLAITHSPFIFDNEMDQLTTSLDVKRRHLADD